MVQGDRGFSSTGAPQVFWAQKIASTQPIMKCTLQHGETSQTTKLLGLIDTGADVTVISQTVWPKSWPKIQVPTTLSGIGGRTLPLQSKDQIIITNPDGIAATVLFSCLRL